MKPGKKKGMTGTNSRPYGSVRKPTKKKGSK